MSRRSPPALLVLVLAAALAACGSRVTLENYQKLKAGMTVEEVEAILGSGTEVEASSGLLSGANAPTKLRWTGGGAAISVTFVDGRLKSLSKEGL